MLFYSVIVGMLVISSIEAMPKQEKRLQAKLDMVTNIHMAISLYGLDSFLVVGDVSGQNRHVVMCKPTDEEALFRKLQNDKRNWGRDRLPNKSHHGKILAYRAKARPSLHLTDVRVGYEHLIEADVDPMDPRWSRPWLIGWHLYDVFRHRLTGGITPPEKVKKALQKLQIKFSNPNY